MPYFFPWRLFLRNKQFLGHNPTIFCRIPCILCISHLCTLHFCPGSGYTDINRYQIQRGNYTNDGERLSMYVTCFDSNYQTSKYVYDDTVLPQIKAGSKCSRLLSFSRQNPVLFHHFRTIRNSQLFLIAYLAIKSYRRRCRENLFLCLLRISFCFQLHHKPIRPAGSNNQHSSCEDLFHKPCGRQP